jgi:formylglycine-generating enzyme required for sulfatase activity
MIDRIFARPPRPTPLSTILVTACVVLALRHGPAHADDLQICPASNSLCYAIVLGAICKVWTRDGRALPAEYSSGHSNEEYLSEDRCPLNLRCNFYRSSGRTLPAECATQKADVTPATSPPQAATSPPPSKPVEAKTFRDCRDVCPEMVIIPAGTFQMGSPKLESGLAANRSPQHTVTIAKAFAVGKFTVTFSEWEACVAGGGCASNKSPHDFWLGRQRRPVIYVSWTDAREYVAWLSKKTGKPYRLLSEAEWEYAARAGSTTMYPWGDEVGTGNANCKICGSKFESNAPVGSFRPNAFGLYDMQGNVMQWVEDNFHGNYEKAPIDGSVWEGGTGALRVVRGSYFHASLEQLRSDYRGTFNPDYKSTSLGFRVARSL